MFEGDCKLLTELIINLGRISKERHLRRNMSCSSLMARILWWWTKRLMMCVWEWYLILSRLKYPCTWMFEESGGVGDGVPDEEMLGWAG